MQHLQKTNALILAGDVSLRKQQPYDLLLWNRRCRGWTAKAQIYILVENLFLVTRVWESCQAHCGLAFWSCHVQSWLPAVQAPHLREARNCNSTYVSLCSLHCGCCSPLHKFLAPSSPRWFPCRSSSVRCWFDSKTNESCSQATAVRLQCCSLGGGEQSSGEGDVFAG